MNCAFKNLVGERNLLETVSLDFGGTLAYEVKDDHIVFYEILSELGYKVDVEQLKDVFRSVRDWWRWEKVKTGKLWNEEAFIELIQHMISALRLPNPRKLALQVSELWPHRVVFRAYEDVEPALKELKKRGFRFIIISNVSSLRNLSIYLSRIGLESYFDLLVASGSVGYEKPNPEIFKLASKMSNTPLEKMMHIGDSYENDYLGAESVGIMGVLLDRKGLYKNRRCRKISKLTDLLNLIDEML